MIEVVEFLGGVRSHKNGEVGIETLDDVYDGWWHVNDYDGMESICVNHEGYMISLVRNVVYDANLTVFEKLQKIIKIID